MSYDPSFEECHVRFKTISLNLFPTKNYEITFVFYLKIFSSESKKKMARIYYFFKKKNVVISIIAA